MVLKGLRHAMGVGSADEYYAKALTHLAAEASGQSQRADAVKAFERAAEKADGRPDLRARAQANAALHRFILEGNPRDLDALRRSMPQALWIERPGDAGEQVPAEPLVAEVEGRLAVQGVRSDGGMAAVEAHQAAAAAFARCGEHRLVTYPHHHTGDEHVGTARARQQFHTAMAQMLAARLELKSDPEQAVQTLGRAVASFAACGDQERQEQCADFLRRAQKRRTCWMCHREFPGDGTYYTHVKARLTPFVETHLHASGQDASSVDVENGQLVLCRVCQSVVEEKARGLLNERLPAFAASLRAEFDGRMDELRTELMAQSR